MVSPYVIFNGNICEVLAYDSKLMKNDTLLVIGYKEGWILSSLDSSFSSNGSSTKVVDFEFCKINDSHIGSKLYYVPLKNTRPIPQMETKLGELW